MTAQVLSFTSASDPVLHALIVRAIREVILRQPIGRRPLTFEAAAPLLLEVGYTGREVQFYFDEAVKGVTP